MLASPELLDKTTPVDEQKTLNSQQGSYLNRIYQLLF